MDRTRIVIAEDDDVTRKDLRETLEGLGYLVVGEARDGRSAANLAQELKPDIVIMDIQMPGMDGIDAAELLTKERIAPVLLLTAYYDKAKVERAKEAGVIAYLVKPFSESDLEPAIEVALSRFQELRELDAEVERLEEALETRKLVDRAKGILMDSQGLTESEAFRKIQKMSMDTRRPMKDIAQAIIITHEATN
ncbi:MAG: response regulator [Chloroflexi bacterium]|nr:MAG: response regulator [Chloroflexota bacterium]